MSRVYLSNYNTSYEAHLVKGMLKNHGIESFISNENNALLFPHLNGMSGAGVQLSVNGEDASRALALLENQPTDTMPLCPLCGSERMVPDVKNSKIQKMLFVAATLLSGLMFAKIKKPYRCLDCQNSFKI